MAHPPLPAGLDPVRAGRLGLWLLGQRSHRRSLRRTVSVPRVPNARIQSRFVHLLVPWRVYEYPGQERVFAELLGIKPRTVRTYLYEDRRRLPKKHIATMLRVARERAEQWAELVRDLEGKDQGF